MSTGTIFDTVSRKLRALLFHGRRSSNLCSTHLLCTKSQMLRTTGSRDTSLIFQIFSKGVRNTMRKHYAVRSNVGKCHSSYYFHHPKKFASFLATENSIHRSPIPSSIPTLTKNHSIPSGTPNDRNDEKIFNFIPTDGFKKHTQKINKRFRQIPSHFLSFRQP